MPTLLSMTHWLKNPLQHLQLGEALIANGVDAMARGWQASTEVIGKLCTGGADRWQAAIRQIQTTANLADVLRGRTLL